MLEAKIISSEIRKRSKPPLMASFEQYCKFQNPGEGITYNNMRNDIKLSLPAR